MDSDYGKLRYQKNKYGITPYEMSKGKYDDILITIWDRVKQGNLQKIREYAI